MKLLKTLLAAPKLLLRADPVTYYKFLGDDVVEGATQDFQDPNKPLWLNLGYWKTARTYPEAASAMARLLGSAAELSAQDKQLDVGFGFAEQDFLWLNEYAVGHITGVNITPLQVEHATKRAVQRKLSDRLALRVGSATELPFEAGSFTKVTALECAHHFLTREQFFAEAMRVLAPGGRLGLCDGVPQPGHGSPNIFTKMVLRHWASPVENYYDRNVYKQKLERLGFVNVRVQSIAQDVFPGTVLYSEQRRRGVSMADAKIEITPSESQRALKIWSRVGLTDYLLVTADKPA